MKHILIIDDEAPVREVLVKALTRQCYRVSQAVTSADGRRMIVADPPDLIITDLQLEDGDGLELAGDLKKLLPKVPIILLTGVIFDAEVVHQTILKKVDAYLEKTTPLHQVLAEVRRLLGG